MLDELLAALAAAGLFFVAFVYIYAPLSIRKKQARGLQANVVAIDATRLPPDAVQFIGHVAAQLAELGFVRVGYATLQIPRPTVDAFTALFVHEQAGDSAQAIVTRLPKHALGPLITLMTAFRTEFTDDSAIVTANSKSPTVFPSDPQTDSISCSGLSDNAILYRIHRARVERDRGARVATIERCRDVVLRVEHEHQDLFTRMTLRGYYDIDAGKQQYVPTIRGMYLMAWRLMFPFKQIQIWQRRRKANRVLKSLGFGGVRALQNEQR